MAEALASHTEDQIYVPAASKWFLLLKRKEVGTTEPDMMKLAKSSVSKIVQQINLCKQSNCKAWGKKKKYKKNDKDSRNWIVHTTAYYQLTQAYY